MSNRIINSKIKVTLNISNIFSYGLDRKRLIGTIWEDLVRTSDESDRY